MLKKLTFTFISVFITQILNAQLINDQSYFDADFIIFKSKLIQAINKKDSLTLSSLMDDTVFGLKDECGIKGCSKADFFKYSFSTNDDSNWLELSKIVRFGFLRKLKSHPYGLTKMKEQVYQAPSYLDKFDYEKNTAILGENVNIRELPSVDSKVIDKLSFEIVSCECGTSNMKKDSFTESDGIRWVKIRLKDGRTGYVAEKYTSNIIWREITVIKINGEWKIKSISPTMFC